MNTTKYTLFLKREWTLGHVLKGHISIFYVQNTHKNHAAACPIGAAAMTICTNPEAG